MKTRFIRDEKGASDSWRSNQDAADMHGSPKCLQLVEISRFKKSSKSIYPKDKPGSVCTTPLDSCVTTEVTWIKTRELCSTATGFIYLFFSFTLSKQIERFGMQRYRFQHSENHQIPGGFLSFFFFLFYAAYTPRVGGALSSTHALASR